MALVLADRVQETTVTTGTGTITLAGAVSGFQSFSAIGNGNTTYYTIVSGANWEVGIGTYTLSGTTLSRDTVLSSSAGGSKITLSGTSNVFVTYPAGRSVGKDAANVLTLDAGTTTIPPLDFQAGTNLTSASAGAMEYDGKVGYFTPQGTQRGVIPGEQFYRLNSANVGLNATGAQNLLGVGVTLSSSTVYAFEILCPMSKTAGTTSHNVTMSFGGTATLNNIAFLLQRGGSIASFTAISATSILQYAQTNSLQTVTASVDAALYIPMRMQGTVSVNVGGTFIPQYTLSAAPGGAYTVALGSYMRIYPIGASGANTNVGTWA